MSKSVCAVVGAGARVEGGLGGRGAWTRSGQREFLRAGTTVRVAWDASKEALLVAVDGAALAPLFPDEVLGSHNKNIFVGKIYIFGKKIFLWEKILCSFHLN